MSDSGGVVKAGGGGTKFSVAIVYMDISQHITPPLAGKLLILYPILGESVCFEIVVAGLALLGGLLVKLTPQHFVDTVKDGILYWRGAFKTWRAALGDDPPA